MLEQSDHVEFRRGIGDSSLSPHQPDFPPSPDFGAGMRNEPEFVNVQGAQESIPIKSISGLPIRLQIRAQMRPRLKGSGSLEENLF
jgi:hypothetical protein